MKFIHTILVLFCIGFLPLIAQNDSEAEAILKSVSEKYKTIESSTVGNGKVKSISTDNGKHTLEINGKQIPVDQILTVKPNSTTPNAANLVMDQGAVSQAVNAATQDLMSAMM